MAGEGWKKKKLIKTQRRDQDCISSNFKCCSPEPKLKIQNTLLSSLVLVDSCFNILVCLGRAPKKGFTVSTALQLPSVLNTWMIIPGCKCILPTSRVLQFVSFWTRHLFFKRQRKFLFVVGIQISLASKTWFRWV